MLLVCGLRSSHTTAKEREPHENLHAGVGEVDVQEFIWQQTLKEVENGALGPMKPRGCGCYLPTKQEVWNAAGTEGSLC